MGKIEKWKLDVRGSRRRFWEVRIDYLLEKFGSEKIRDIGNFGCVVINFNLSLD